jgi:hypothetical protein
MSAGWSRKNSIAPSAFTDGGRCSPYRRPFPRVFHRIAALGLDQQAPRDRIVGRHLSRLI